MQVQIIEWNRGGKTAVHNGHSYNQKQSLINCIHWRCTKYSKLKCPAILKTKNETVIETKGTHNHKGEPRECKAKKVVNQIKRRVQYSTSNVAIAKKISQISDDYAVDGTLKLSPEIFHQIHSIHVELNGFASACVYVLLPKKKQKKTIKHWLNCWVKKPWQNTGRPRKGSTECFQQKIPPRRNLVLLFRPDAIFQPENQWDRIENLLRKVSRIQPGT